MGLSLRHCAIDVHMSGLRERCLSLGGFGSTVGLLLRLLATVSVQLPYRAEAKVAAILTNSTPVTYLTLVHCVHKLQGSF